MQLKLLVLAALQGLVAAQNTVFSEVLCVTSSGRVSVSPVRRTTVTETTGLTFRTTVCPAARTITRTITPASVTITSPRTATEFRTVTTISVTGTSTVSVTGDPVTSTNFVTITTTSTSVSTSIITESRTSTVTVPPPPGFTALSEEPDYVAKKKRSLAGRIPLHKRAPCRGSDATRPTSRAQARSYPQSVRCLNVVKTISVSTVVPRTCSTARTATVTAATGTSTVFRTVTTFVATTVTVQTGAAATVTVNPTVTTVSSVTVEATATSITTTTSTINAPAQTVYAACAQNNLVGSANGGHQFAAINVNSGGTQNQVSSRSATTGYDCCVACQQTANCIFSYFDNAGSCEVVTGDTCNPQDNQGTSFETSEDGQLNYVLSNGGCGRVANGGDT
ncbi:hypothetical protein ACHAPT_010243 [Fusarium lateritium]